MARASRQEWAKRVRQWNESGLTGAVFAARIGVKEATLRHWKWALRRERGTPARVERAPTFVEIAPAVLAAGQQEPFELHLSADRWLRVPATFDEAALRRLLAILGER